jgi:predicted nucleic acid-binding Zn ribbon protein
MHVHRTPSPEITAYEVACCGELEMVLDRLERLHLHLAVLNAWGILFKVEGVYVTLSRAG